MPRIISLLLLILISPIFAIIALLIILDDGFPVIFKQKRIGKNNINFLIYKFRTMKKNTPDIPTHLVKESKNYYTFLGPLLRKYSIDEIPQLINIIKGEMVFVGPRPALHNQEDLKRLRVEKGIDKLKPGITGWAQINGRDELTIPKKVELEEYYLKNKSFWLNLKIILKTVMQVPYNKGMSH